MLRSRSIAIILIAVVVGRQRARADAYDPPGAYYSAATGTGETLKSQLAAAMSAGHIPRNYGAFRDSAAITDADPDRPGNILLVYNRASVPGAWDGGATWNREHVWPVSLQPGGDPSNSTTGHRGDPHALRPANPGINTSRSNKPFGLDGTSGGYGHVNSAYYFPGDADQGDVARQLFYSDTRYGASLGLSLTDAAPGGNQMGDLSSLMAWHFLDPPDEFERRRNQAIYSQAMNPSFYTNNRSAYVDRPEFVWSVYVDQMNDSQITLHGGAPHGAGGTTVDLDLGRILVGGPSPAPQTLTLNKGGMDGTYFEVTTSGAATSSIMGRYNAFRTAGTDSRTFEVGLGADTAAPGLKIGSVMIDNLDVTAGGGAGRGANDGNDVVTVGLSVLDHANSSFSVTHDVNSLTYDFGTIELGAPPPTFTFDVFNLESISGMTAALKPYSVFGEGNVGEIPVNFLAYYEPPLLLAGESKSFAATLDTSAAGAFWVRYSIRARDEDLPGAMFLENLTLTLTGVVAPTTTADFDADGDVDGADFLAWQRGVGAEAPDLADGDGNFDGVVNGLDLQIWHGQFGAASVPGPLTVPEPDVRILALALISCITMRRRAV